MPRPSLRHLFTFHRRFNPFLNWTFCSLKGPNVKSWSQHLSQSIIEAKLPDYQITTCWTQFFNYCIWSWHATDHSCFLLRIQHLIFWGTTNKKLFSFVLFCANFQTERSRVGFCCLQKSRHQIIFGWGSEILWEKSFEKMGSGLGRVKCHLKQWFHFNKLKWILNLACQMASESSGGIKNKNKGMLMKKKYYPFFLQHFVHTLWFLQIG